MEKSFFHSILYCFFHLLLLAAQCHSIVFFNKSPIDVEVMVATGRSTLFENGDYYKVLSGKREIWHRWGWSKMYIWISSSKSIISIDLDQTGYVNFYGKDNTTVMQQYGRDTIFVRTPKPKSEMQQLQRKEQRASLGLDDSKENIVITGNSGTGKSTFINSIRNIDDGNLKAAPVGETETTMMLQQYVHPKYPQIHIWDTPGFGTQRNPSYEYFGNNSVYMFDIIVILSAERFTEGEHNIVKEAMDWNITTFLVRNKAKISDDNRKRRGINETEQQFIHQIKTDIISHLNRKEALRTNVYVIDTHHPKSYEYESLEKRLLYRPQQSNKEEI